MEIAKLNMTWRADNRLNSKQNMHGNKHALATNNRTGATQMDWILSPAGFQSITKRHNKCQCNSACVLAEVWAIPMTGDILSNLLFLLTTLLLRRFPSLSVSSAQPLVAKRAQPQTTNQSEEMVPAHTYGAWRARLRNFQESAVSTVLSSAKDYRSCNKQILGLVGSWPQLKSKVTILKCTL